MQLNHQQMCSAATGRFEWNKAVSLREERPCVLKARELMSEAEFLAHKDLSSSEKAAVMELQVYTWEVEPSATSYGLCVNKHLALEHVCPVLQQEVCLCAIETS